MESVELGRTGLRISRLGLGLASLGGMFAAVSEQQAVATIDRAWELGIRLFDTAPVYGYGLSEQRAGLARRGRSRDEFPDCILLAGRYTLLDQTGADELLPLCHDLGVAVLAAGVFQGGVLADSSDGAPHGYGKVPAELAARITALHTLCRQYHVPLLAAAMQFPLAHPSVRAVVVGARTPAEITQVASLLDEQIPADFWPALERQGLITASAWAG